MMKQANSSKVFNSFEDFERLLFLLALVLLPIHGHLIVDVLIHGIGLLHGLLESGVDLFFLKLLLNAMVDLGITSILILVEIGVAKRGQVGVHWLVVHLDLVGMLEIGEDLVLSLLVLAGR